jgi:D-threo-aldose 1-dehydrogenase
MSELIQSRKKNILNDTSSLGFGCVGMTTHKTQKDALMVLEVAYDCGITHFDVARLYGFGQAEGILGEFVKYHRDSITITSKFGLNPTHTITQYKSLISTARKTINEFPFLKSLLKKVPNNLVKSRAFSAKDAKKSLEISLKELNTDYLDFWLLHECLPESASNYELLDFLDKMIQEGKILHYGVGTNYSNIQGVLDMKPCQHQVIQFEQSLLQQNLQRLHGLGNRLIITHSVFKEANPIIAASQQYPELTKKYSNIIGLDLSRKQIIIGLLLAYAVFVNPNGMVLFSSTKSEHIYSNIKMLEEIKYSEQIFGVFFDFLKNILSFDVVLPCQ